MTTQIALLRAVNLPGHNKISMSALCELVTELGFENARTLLQSGNLIFESKKGTGVQLERTLEAAAKKQLGLEIDFIVRSAKEWKTVIAGNPFLAEARRDPGHLVALCLKAPTDSKHINALQQAITGREQVRGKGRDLYVYYPDGIGRSRLTNAVFEKRLGVCGTGRNWNTVLKLGALTEVEG